MNFKDARRHIYWRPDVGHKNGNCFANIHLLVKGNQGFITDFLEMAQELRRTFPKIQNDQIGCGTVFDSKTVAGFIIITWDGYLPMSNYPGWCSHSNGKEMDYHW